MDFLVVAMLLASVLSVGLAAYALFLWQKLRARQTEIESAREQLTEQLQVKNLDARQSIQIIARALLQKDLTDTEAAMRIAFLSRQVTATEAELKQFTVFQQLAEATAYIPILDDWAMLEKSEKKRLNRERTTIEAKYSEFIQAGAQQLINIKLS
ncbi:DUF2489 domain-containing protein [Porticoccaceae bacterium]|jgi:Flp pilus assembly protein TadB|nr:DUF2489 domain-containing protein [Porticoccaceae bacterium]MDC0641090.1 DUF2489 domain-containing protein [Porticoccaceae bacterium]